MANERDGYSCYQHDDKRKEPEEPYDSKLDAIDKKVCPPGEVGSWFCSPVYSDNIARDEEREEDTEAGKNRDLAPRYCIPVHASTLRDCLWIEDKPYERERER